MTQIPADDPNTRLWLRHTLATLAYRAGKTVRGTPAAFGDYRADAKSPRVSEILAHMGDLMDWILTMMRGAPKWNNSTPLAWDDEVARFFDTVKRFDDYLASDAPLGSEPERLFQGAIADALTHVGQLAMLRRLAGCPIKGENYYQADIVAGRVGSEQAAARREF